MARPDIVRLILNKAAEEAKYESHTPNIPGVYRASDIGGCPRALQYATLGYTPEPSSPATQIAIFDEGHHQHNMVRGLLAKVGHVTNVEMRISKRYKHKGIKIHIIGTIDGAWNGYPFDIKGINTFRFVGLHKNYPNDYQNYVWQLQIYLDVLDKKWGFFLYKNKNDGELCVIWVKRNPFLMQRILDRLVEVNEGCKTKTVTISRPYKHTDWHCEWCRYRIHCWKRPMKGKIWTMQDKVNKALRQTSKDDLESKLRESLGRKPKA